MVRRRSSQRRKKFQYLKLYLTKNTLNSITEEQGNIIKAGGSFVVNNASIVDNSGKIIAKNNVLIKSKNIYQNAAYSDTGIYANDVALIAKENIENYWWKYCCR